jgi:hypothetical protein
MVCVPEDAESYRPVSSYQVLVTKGVVPEIPSRTSKPPEVIWRLDLTVGPEPIKVIIVRVASGRAENLIHALYATALLSPPAAVIGKPVVSRMKAMWKLAAAAPPLAIWKAYEPE